MYIFVHAIFSVYIRIRVAYHAVSLRILSILKYHHNTPDYVRRDVSTLNKLPKHVSVILTLEDGGRAGDALEKLVNEASEVAAWCTSAGIPRLSIYERTGEQYKSLSPCETNKFLKEYSNAICPRPIVPWHISSRVGLESTKRHRSPYLPVGPRPFILRTESTCHMIKFH